MEGVIAVTLIFMVPIVAIVTSYHSRLMEMKLKSQQGVDQSVVREIEALKQQVMELRDTTSRYDMSFDAALQRLDSRVGHIESRISSTEHNVINS